MARLLVDAMCGRLARYLRFCGHDAPFVLDRDVTAAASIAQWAHEEDRIVVSRNRSLADHDVECIILTSTAIDEQLREIDRAGIPLEMADPPVRCGRCNGSLKAVHPKEPLPEYVPQEIGHDVYTCTDCGQYFWRGSHWDRVHATIETALTHC